MTTDVEILALRDAYKTVQAANVIAVRCGPIVGWADHSIGPFWERVVSPAIVLVHKTAIKVGNVYVCKAPSPWHAYFYLRAVQWDVYKAQRPLTETWFADGVPGEHLFFRGQRCADWPFESSLARARRNNAAAALKEVRAAIALEHYWRRTFTQGDPAAIGQSFAQHYGIATDLADISGDADVAVWFATHPYKKPCDGGVADGIIRAVSWAGQQECAPTVAYIPPPFVRNVYLQRGLFLDTSGSGGVLAGRVTLDVRFPRETAGGEFEVIRDGNPVVIWPNPDTYEKDLVDWARKIGGQAKTDEEVETLVANTPTAALPSFHIDRKLDQPDLIVEDWLSILDWLLPATCVVAEPDLVGGFVYVVQESKVRALASRNPMFFTALCDAFAQDDIDIRVVPYIEAVVDFAKDELGLP